MWIALIDRIKGVIERDLANIAGVRIVKHGWINEENQIHIDRFTGRQRLLFKTKALDFAEVLACFERRDIENTRATCWQRHQIPGVVTDSCSFAGCDHDRALIGLYPPA